MDATQSLRLGLAATSCDPEVEGSKQAPYRPERARVPMGRMAAVCGDERREVEEEEEVDEEEADEGVDDAVDADADADDIDDGLGTIINAA